MLTGQMTVWGTPSGEVPSTTKAREIYHSLPYGKLQFAVKSYWSWVNDPKQLLFENTEDDSLLLIPSKKRGNEPYRKHVSNKLQSIRGKFFKHLDKRYSYRRDQGAGAVFVTLTYKDGDLSAWETVGADYNRFMARFRKRFGRCDVVRVWESMANGRPHIHALILLKTRVSAYMNKGRLWFGHSVWQDLQGLWSHGFSGFDVVRNVGGSYRYILKYITKATVAGSVGGSTVLEMWEQGEELPKAQMEILKGILTNALSWVYRKRQYGLTPGLLKSIQRGTNSNSGTPQSSLAFLGSVPEIFPSGVIEARTWEAGVLRGLIPDPPAS